LLGGVVQVAQPQVRPRLTIQPPYSMVRTILFIADRGKRAKLQKSFVKLSSL
jgi:hypothetical protein